VTGSSHLDFAITVCDKAAGEVCPIWPGQPMTAHWGIPDPAAVDGTPVDKMTAFRTTFKELETRINLFLNLPIGVIDRMTLRDHMDAIGETPRAAPGRRRGVPPT
jgi:hypothetical protein